MKKSSKKKFKVYLVLILLVGLVLRFSNLNIGFPILYVSNDEAIYHLSALNMLSEKTILPLGNYGPLGSYIQLPFLIFAYLGLLVMGLVSNKFDMEFLLITHPGYLLAVPRFISAVFGFLSIFLSYKISKLLFNSEKIALFSSLLFALSFNLVHISHLARAWSPAIFCSMASVFYSLKSINHKNEIKNIYLAYFFAALSFGFHQVAGLVVVQVFLIRLFVKRNMVKIFTEIKEILPIIFWIFLIILFTYLSVGANLLNLANPSSGSSGFMKLAVHVKKFSDLPFYVFNLQLHFDFIKGLLFSDGFIVLLAILTIFRNFQNPAIKAISIFVLTSFLVSTFIFIPLIRYFLVPFSLLPILAGWSLNLIFNNKKISFLAVIIILVISFNSFYWNVLLWQKPTFTQVRQWLDQNIASEVPIASTLRRNFDYVPNAQASVLIRQFKPSYYKRAAELVKNNYPDNVRNVVYLNEFQKENKFEEFLISQKTYPVKFVVDSYWQKNDRLLNQNDKFILVAHFSPTKNIIYDQEIPSILFDSGLIFTRDFTYPLLAVDRAGPYFDILKVK